MARFDLKISFAGRIDPSWVPSLPLRIPDTAGAMKSLAEVYLAASEKKIDMRPEILSRPFLSSTPALGAEKLQEVLKATTANPAGIWPVPRLGLIYAPFYLPKRGVYGLMFDEGTSDPADPVSNDDYHRSPREGCAVFLGAIAASDLAPTDYQNQVAFTTVHELAHTFNLRHLESTQCFLNTSSFDPPSLSAFTFLPLHIERMARVDFDKTVAPGGAQFSRDGIFPAGDSPRLSRKTSSRRLKIEADVTPAEFWPWEPVELDLRLKAGSKEITVPDQLDAGYKNFEIWIEEPSGERRRYRPPRRYCAYPSVIALKSGETWQRDISIFCEAGGYTFSRAGQHLIWVKFEVSPGLYIESEPCAIQVKSWAQKNSRERSRLEEMEWLLRRSRHTLYYRSGNLRSPEIAALEILASKYKKEHAGGSAMYALGRIRAASATSRFNKNMLAGAKSMLARASQSEEISAHRRFNAQKVLEQLRILR